MNEPVPERGDVPPLPPAPTPAPTVAPDPALAALRRLKRETRLAIAIAAMAVALTVLGALEAQREIQEARADLQKEVAGLDATARQAKSLAEQFSSSNRDLETRLAGLESQVSATQTEQSALEALYRDLSINQEDGVLAEVEQAVSIANQELLLAGDVRSAIRAMENASRRMERLNQPSLLNLRRIIEQDLRRLRSVTLIDVAGMSIRIDNFAGAADALPLAAYARPAARSKAPEAAAARGFWSRIGEQLVGELGQAVRIQRSEGPEQAPLAPEQSFFLRQTLKLRLLTARQALLARDETSYRGDLRTAARWVESYFDRQDRGVEKLAEALRQMADTPMAISLPGVEASLSAVRDVRTNRAALVK